MSASSGVVTRRFLPEMVVAHAVTPVAGRPAIDAAQRQGIFIAGDWVGSLGMLTDAGLASARAVAGRILTAGERAAAA